MSGTARSAIWIVSCALVLAVSGPVAQGAAKPPETPKEKESYSIGYQVGLSIRSDGVLVDFDRLIQGLRDAIEGQTPPLGEEEMKSLIVAVRKRAREAQLKTLQETIVRNAEESKKFLEQNAGKEGVKTTESGLQYVVLKDGGGASPGPEDFVTVHYRGAFADGKEFDNSYARGKPEVFETDGVIKGWTEALLMMMVGSKWKVFVPPELAYGRGGLGEKIPPNAVLIFDMELLSINTEKSKSGK